MFDRSSAINLDYVVTAAEAVNICRKKEGEIKESESAVESSRGNMGLMHNISGLIIPACWLVKLCILWQFTCKIPPMTRAAIGPAGMY